MMKNFFKNIFKHKERKESQLAKVIASGYGPAIWTPRNYQNFAEETFMKNVVAFRCILKIAESVASVPWKVFRQIDVNESEIVTDHPLNSVIKRPNPYDSFSFVMMSAIAYFVMSGNAFMERVSPATGPNQEIAKELYSHRPDRVKLEMSNNQLSGYTYSTGGASHTFKIDPITRQSDLLHLRSFHPLNDYWGMAITEPVAREIDTSNEAVLWNKKTFENEGRPGLVMTLPIETTDEQFDAMEKLLREKHTGPGAAGGNLLLRGANVLPYGWNPKEMDFIVSNQDLSRRIAFGYGVPAMLVNIPGDNTYANYLEARQAFWEETVLWYLGYVKGELNNWFFREENELFLDYILDDVPAFALKRKEIWEKANESTFLTINEKRKMVKKPPIKGCDIILVPATMLPIGEDAEDLLIEDDEAEKQIANTLKREGYSDLEINQMLGEQ